MANTRDTLKRIQTQLDESIGVRSADRNPQLSPVPSAKDIGRRALRNFGTLELEQVMPDPDQPRLEFSEQEIILLAKSIHEKGQFHPIHVRWSEEHSKWIIISGERRYRATLASWLPTINCRFQDAELSKTEILEQQLVENLLRQDLRPIEEAKAFSELMDLNDWTATQLSEAIRVSQSKIARALSLLKLAPDIQSLVEQGQLSASAAYTISRLPADQQHAALGACMWLERHRKQPERQRQKSNQRIAWPQLRSSRKRHKRCSRRLNPPKHCNDVCDSKPSRASENPSGVFTWLACTRFGKHLPSVTSGGSKPC